MTARDAAAGEAGTAVTTMLRGWRIPVARGGGLADCSLVIPTYRRAADLMMLFARLCDIPDPPGEVIVVDGSPDQATEHALAAAAGGAELPFALSYVRSAAGLTRQRNAGIDVSRGDLVFFLDDDCVPEPGYFRIIRECFLRDADGVVGGVCGFVDNEVGQPLSLRWRVRLALRIVPRLDPGTYYPTATSMPYALGSRFSGTRRVAVMPGCAMAFRRHVLKRHRFSAFFHGYAQGEDLEMSLRVGREHVVLWCGDAHAVHHQAPAGRPGSLVKARMEVRNRYFIWRRYSPRPRLLERVRFWADMAFSLAWDAAALAARPARLATLRHATGTVVGMAGCLIASPAYQEPPAAREYALDPAEAAGAGRPVAPGRTGQRDIAESEAVR